MHEQLCRELASSRARDGKIIFSCVAALPQPSPMRYISLNSIFHPCFSSCSPFSSCVNDYYHQLNFPSAFLSLIKRIKLSWCENRNHDDDIGSSRQYLIATDAACLSFSLLQAKKLFFFDGLKTTKLCTKWFGGVRRGRKTANGVDREKVNVVVLCVDISLDPCGTFWLSLSPEHLDV